MSYNNEIYKDLPLGFSIALSQDLNALDCFAQMSDSQQKAVVARARRIRDKDKMRDYVHEIKYM